MNLSKYPSLFHTQILQTPLDLNRVSFYSCPPLGSHMDPEKGLRRLRVVDSSRLEQDAANPSRCLELGTCAEQVISEE
jgi:hypothetical protein